MQMHKILSNYILDGEAISVNEYGNGHINKTFLVTTSNNAKYILQQINGNVFKNPEDVMRNIELVTDYIRTKVALSNQDSSRAALEIVPTINFSSYFKTKDSYWRCYKFINGAKTYEQIENPRQFYQVGKAVGRFQRHLKDFPIEKLAITIPDFHNTPVRFQKFLEVASEDRYNRGLGVFNEVKFIWDRRHIMGIIMELLESGEIPYRVTHNDTKLNNVMLDEETDEAICVIDLDTVMPGSVLFDFGDAIRVGASTAAEDEQDLSKVKLDIELFTEFSRGFLEETKDFLVTKEIENLVNSTIIITLECGMRFLTDYLDGDKYFRIHRENHNLDRARTQFKLVSEIEKHKDLLEQIIKSLL